MPRNCLWSVSVTFLFHDHLLLVGKQVDMIEHYLTRSPITDLTINVAYSGLVSLKTGKISISSRIYISDIWKDGCTRVL